MSKSPIHIDNYEEFALDYLENNLSPTMQQSFELFLEFHPDIREELADLLDYSLERPALTFHEKESLKHRSGIYMRPLYRFLAIAAAIAFLFTCAFLWNGQGAAPNAVADETENETPTKAHRSQHSTESFEFDKSTIVQTEEADNITDPAQEAESSVQEISKDQTDIAFRANNATERISESSTPGNVENSPVPITKGHSSRELNNPVVAESSTTPQRGTKTDRISVEIHDQQNTDQAGQQIVATENHSQTLPPLDKTPSEHAQVDIVATTVQPQPSVRALASLQTSTILALGSSKAEEDELHNRIPTLLYEPIDDDRGLVIVSDGEVVNKKKKFSFRNLIPEQIASLSRDDIKQSLIPEAVISR